MGSTITIQVGGAGNRIGLAFWTQLFAEHGLSGSGQQGSNAASDGETFFSKVGSNRYAPRAILVDGDPATQSELAASAIASSLRADNYCIGTAGYNSNYAKGRYTSDLLPAVVAAVQREVGRVDGRADFVVIHALGCGAGSGLGSKILAQLRQDHPDACITSFAVLSDRNDTNILRPYNQVLALRQLRASADLVVLLDNTSLGAAVTAKLNRANPTLAERNPLAGRALALLTAPLRRPKLRGVDWLELARTLTPRKGTPFVGLAVEGWDSPASNDAYANLEVSHNRLGGWEAGNAQILSAAFVVPSGRTLSARQVRTSGLGFPTWYPAAPLVMETDSTDPSVLMVESSTGIATRLGSLAAVYNQLIARKAYFSSYTYYGMEEAEFTLAGTQLAAAIDEYGKV